jgi:hypothetical protein
MKKTQIPFYPEIDIVCTDGSTIKTTFLYEKTDLYMNPDIKSNPIWLPDTEEIDLDDFSKKSTKFKKYEFDFGDLVSEK